MGAHAEALALNAAFLRKIYDSMFPRPKPPTERPPRLLVVEDSATDYLVLRKRLEPLIEQTGVELLHASSLSEALREIDLADAIILDMLLPDANDSKTNKLFADLTRLPILLYTNSQDAEADRLAKRIGAQIVRKNEPKEAFEAAVRRLIGRRDVNLSLRLTSRQGREQSLCPTVLSPRPLERRTPHC
jgi:PleD family two-component response regulator